MSRSLRGPPALASATAPWGRAASAPPASVPGPRRRMDVPAARPKYLEYLHFAPADLLEEYRANTRVFDRRGIDAFAAYVVDRGPARTVPSRRALAARPPVVAYPPLLPGGLPPTPDDFLVFELAIHGRALLSPRLRARLSRRAWLVQSEPRIPSLVDRALEFRALQNRSELSQLLRRVRDLQPRTVVEIGTARGGTLFAL